MQNSAKKFPSIGKYENTQGMERNGDFLLEAQVS
jgi:hypothetical protein